MRRSNFSILMLAALVLPWMGCDEAAEPGCPGGCSAGQVCNFDAGVCVEVRPASEPPDRGRYATVAENSAGRLVVATYAARYGDLVYGREREDGAFDWEYVDGLPSVSDPAFRQDPPHPIVPGPDVGLYASMQLDGLDRPHVAYFDRSAGLLKHALKTGDGWKIETVPQLGQGDHLVGRGASLFMGSDDLPRIAFLDESLGEVQLAKKLSADRWLVEKVSSCGLGLDWPGELSSEPGRFISLVLDRQDREWIAFSDPCSGKLQLSSRKPDGWTSLELDQGPEAGAWVSAAADPDGNVAVAYHHRGDGSLKFAWNEGGSMKVMVVDDGRQVDESGAEQRWPVGQHCALIYGQDGLARILYLDGRGLDLALVGQLGQGGFSEPELLEAAGVVGLFNAAVSGLDDLRVVTYRLMRDEAGQADGLLLTRRLPSGSTGRGW